MALFQRGFAKYLQTGEFADVILVYGASTYILVIALCPFGVGVCALLTLEGTTEFKAHKIILAYSSEFFAKLLSGNWKESTMARVELKHPDPAGIAST